MQCGRKQAGQRLAWGRGARVGELREWHHCSEGWGGVGKGRWSWAPVPDLTMACKGFGSHQGLGREEAPASGDGGAQALCGPPSTMNGQTQPQRRSGLGPQSYGCGP